MVFVHATFIMSEIISVIVKKLEAVFIASGYFS